MNTPAARRHLHSVPALRHEPAVQVFPVRFSLVAGPAGLLQRSNNLFGCFGNGALRFDEQGPEVRAPRRALLGLRARARIHPHEVRAVYREGNAVQLDLRTNHRRGRLRFWAASAAAAAAIVELLPARGAVEFDVPLQGAPGPPARARSWWLPTLGMLAALVLFWFGVSRLLGPAHPGAALPEPRTVMVRQPAPAAPAADAADVLAARALLQKYDARFVALDGQFMTAFVALQLGNLSRKQFVDGLTQWLLPQWEALALQLRTANTAPGPTLSRALEPLDATVDNVRRALFLYARGLREQDVAQVQQAFRYLRDAETQEAEARRLLAELERAPATGTETR
ncbi:MAG TPA: hypothetical protein VEY89_09815 [Candidatus Dormibacteraeota bacterium]|nr:hypothetical protein [Candidatus Dormibacteraeota bacterium]